MEASIPGRFVRLGTLALLYFVQGAPYGFQTACLPLILREAGLSFTALGAMKLLFLPWVCKPLYAPILERTRSKRWWLTSSMLALGTTCLLAAAFSSPSQLTAISVLMFALNFFSASQDIATDSLAIQILPRSELGAGNTVQVVAYKAGSVFAGGLLLWVREAFGWDMMFVGFGSIYFVGVALLRNLSLVERSSEHLDLPSKEQQQQASDERPGGGGASAIARQVFSVRGTLYVVLFVSFYKLCERAEQTFSLYMVDKRVPTAQMAFWSTVMRTFSLIGSTYGGYLLSAPGGMTAKDILSKYCWLRTLPIVGQFVILHLWGTAKVPDPEATFSASAFAAFNRDAAFMYAGFVCTSLTLFCAGVITTAAFTLMMRLSQTAPADIQGTHYTTLATFEVLGKLSFASVAGGLIDHFGLEFAYVMFVLLAALCVPFIAFMPKVLQSADMENGASGTSKGQ